MAKLFYFVLLAAVVWTAHADQDDEDQDFIPDSTQNNREIKCGKYYAQYPNPEDCSSYIVCQKGQKTIKSCPSGQHYNFKTIRCVEPCEAYCNKTLSCECKWSTCGLDDVCFLEQIVGGCRNRVAKYSFNKRTGQCERFSYSGCRGNENNFETLEECQQKCSKAKPIPGFRCLMMNGLFPNPDNCRTYFQCSGGKPQLKSCESGLHYSDKSKTCEKPCNAYCDKSLSCKCKWPTCGLDYLCFLPPEVGPCRAGFYNYHFNRRTGQCEKFLYGGCRGNKNNFQKKEECEKACTKSEEPPVDETPEPTSEEITENTEPTLEGITTTTEPISAESTEPILEDSTEPPVDEFSDPPEEEVLDPSFECGPDGLYPHRKNCRSFVKCTKGVPSLNSCPEKLHFNNQTKKCETPCKAHCDRTYACQCKWPTCGTNGLCFLPAKPGPCKGEFERFYFNKRSGECTTFKYSGCLGNENNFITKHKCERKCKHSLDICKLPYKTGPCKGKFKRYFFNHKDGKCQKFSFGGCRGNHNNFKTLEECETTCLQNKDQAAYPLLGCTQENSTWTNNDDCSTYYRCSGGETQLVKCPSGQHYNLALKRCTAPCDAFCEPSLACKCGWPTCKKSEDFTCVKDGLFKDPESCRSYIHCVNGQKYDMPCPSGYHFNEKTKLCESPSKAQCQEQEANSENICRLPAETGLCKGYFPRYYFNHKEGECKKFIYGGCKGNANNFKSKEECENSCLRNAEDSSSETICTEDGMRLDFENCGRYIQCSNGKEQIMSCPPGLHFNEVSKQCDSPCDARCDESLAVECEWPMEGEKIADPGCEEDGVFTDLSSCSHYIHCSNGRKSVKSCPPSLHFNEKTKRCDSPCDARCDLSLAFECGWPMGADCNCGSGGTCHMDSSGKETCKCFEGYTLYQGYCYGIKCPFPDGKLPFPGNDAKYIKCTNNKATVQQCPEHHLFDFMQRICVRHDE